MNFGNENHQEAKLRLKNGFYNLNRSFKQGKTVKFGISKI